MRASLVVTCVCLVSCGDASQGPGPALDAGIALGDARVLRVDARPALPTTTTLVISITEGDDGPPIPGRVVLYGEDGAALRIGSIDMYNTDQDRSFCDLAPGVIGTWDGIAVVDGTGEIPVGMDRCIPGPAVPFGRYRLVALQGIEHELFETQVDLTANRGKVMVHAPLARAFTPTGALAADLHVHALGSGDSTVPRDVRVQSELVTGIKVLAASDHNLNSSYVDEIEALGLGGKIAALSSNEASGTDIHANVFPVVIDETLPGNGAPPGQEIGGLTARALFDRLHALPRSPFVQLNHPRLRFAAYFDAFGWDGVTWPPPMPIDFDGVEVVCGWYAWDVAGDERRQLALQDLFTLIEHGKLVTALANSDTHHLSSILAGLPRNYVFVDDPTLLPFDEEQFVDALWRRRVLVTTGPWLEVSVGGATAGGQTSAIAGGVHILANVRQASYVKATRLRVWLGGVVRETVAIPDGAVEFAWSGDLDVGSSDTWVAVAVDGTEVLPVELHGAYLGHRPEVPGMQPFALANPVLVDADGDGHWAPPAAKPVSIPDVVTAPWRGRASEECAPPGTDLGLAP